MSIGCIVNIQTVIVLRIFCHVTFALGAMYTAYVIYGHASSPLLLGETQMTICAWIIFYPHISRPKTMRGKNILGFVSYSNPTLI